MSSHATATAPRNPVRAPPPNEHSHLLHWGHAAEEGHATGNRAEPSAATAVTAPAHHGMLDHLARFTHPAGSAQPAAEAHARHFWHIDQPKAQVARPYKPGIADAIRLDGLTLSAEVVLLTYAGAGFIDAMFPRGTTGLNTDGKRHDLIGIACLLGAYLAYRSVAPALAGNLYGALLFGCTKVNDRLHAHPISTRLTGYAGASALSLGAAAGALSLHLHNRHNTEVRLPEQGWQPSIYSSASVLALAASVPAMAAVGWYMGRIASAVCHKRP